MNCSRSAAEFYLKTTFLIGPLLLSMGFHLTGVINIPRINEFVFLAQIVNRWSCGRKVMTGQG